MTTFADDPSDPDRVPLSPEMKEKLGRMLMKAFDTPEMRANVDRINDVFGRAMEKQARELAVSPAMQRINVALSQRLELQAQEVMRSPAMERVREQVAALAPQIEQVHANLFASMRPQIEQLNRDVLAALVASKTASASETGSDSVAVTAVGEVATAEDEAALISSAGSILGPMSPTEAILIVVTLYSFLKDVTDDNFMEAARNGLWSIALLLVILMMQSKPSGEK
ncbi:hypothetical protein EUA93_08840 [Nocardioides oleivorans]|uniref:Uncharacterized protein n=1 Tax=Nocardioides oleivorans TaxID=273676 RepID=A0A4Q2RZ79_9ACTN|nr:hypothetical protein [Nocardioides oleivorans]RYB94438.1 hypothetical protein EUA93_08840 [Nocardioides oleivorans]